ncbi:BaiN/RdsA family NAD(P)/FAD-dependent oxidoreductase [Neorhodopirellula pilleata]|uniref:Putative succinate dehydrogenase n=1 Tax=Neorhodopirellula pilleata TaxID=2714738 RepID=A0A5C6AUZ9_9BACT|nr:aminoacetone oxidase family FAD-binding enzyme [Neorhodopirellula pilleata]TWU03560.1 putative succinate dehydrogenase [Neorhodopirellula pilleata]
METTQRRRIVIIGAGAAGMMAAAVAARRGAEVILLEKNRKTGVKILMSGGTRCNLTQDTDAKGITEAFAHAKRFLQPSVGRFCPADVIAHFESLGVATKREVTGKIFPQSDRAVDVRDALHRDMINAGVRLEMDSPVQNLNRLDDGTWAVTTKSSEGMHEVLADRVIVTSGGQSWPGCGTTGDAYAWLRNLGHEIVRPRPALVPLVGGTEATRSLSGLTLDDVIAEVFTDQFKSGKKPKVQRRSSWLFTHFGFSGPAAMDVSGAMTEMDEIRQARLRVDLIPQVTEDELQQVFRQQSGQNGKQHVSTALARWLPSRLAEVLSTECGARTDAGEKTMAEVSAETRRCLADRLKRWSLPVYDTRGFAKAEVTAGGVSLKDVDPKTMQSRRCNGLFLAGEVLDVDGWIGGYNFQAAFSTGRAAAIAACE